MTDKETYTTSKIVPISYASAATGTTRKANVLLPAGYSKDKTYPVLYLMHGITGTEETLLKYGAKEVIDTAISSGDASAMIVVFPNGCANETGLQPEDVPLHSLEHYGAYDNFINDLTSSLMPYIEEHFSVATGRKNTAIAGFSMGGRISLQVTFTLPEMFGFVGGFCPAPGILEHTDFDVHEEGFFTEDTFTLPDSYKHDTYVLIMTGTNDHMVGDEPEKYHTILEKNGVINTFYKTMGGEHEGGNGGHNPSVYHHGLRAFLRKTFR